MAAVKVDRGPVEAIERLEWVPRERWPELLRARRSFVQINIPADCRKLLQFIEEAGQMYAELGYSDVQDLVRRGLEIDPSIADWAVKGLKAIKASEPVPLESAVKLGKAQAMAADPEVKALTTHAEAIATQPRGGDGKVSTKTDLYDVKNGSGNSAAYLVRRLKRDAPDVAAQLAQGAFKSARAAAIAAGIIREKTRVEQAMAHVRRMSQQELYEFEDRLNQHLSEVKR